MKISVVMVDGGFRENAHAARYFCEQDLPDADYEVIWVEYYGSVHADVAANPRIRSITLDRDGIYHSSRCFNRGVAEARGEVIVLPDADQIVGPDFLRRVWERHLSDDRLVLYGYRYDEDHRGALRDHSLAELEARCVLRNPTNYGGCLSVRKKWLVHINGYEQHALFQTGNHTNGLDIYTRFKNLGLAVMWDPELILYHPWHPSTLSYTTEHESQQRLIDWRRRTLQWQALEGMDPRRDGPIPAEASRILEREVRRLRGVWALAARVRSSLVNLLRSWVQRASPA